MFYEPSFVLISQPRFAAGRGGLGVVLVVLRSTKLGFPKGCVPEPRHALCF